MCLNIAHCAAGIRSLILAWTPLWISIIFAAPSYPCALILSINMPKFTRLVKTARFLTGSFACTHKTKKFLTKNDFTTSAFYNLTHTETCSYVETSVASSPIKPQALVSQVKKYIPRYELSMYIFFLPETSACELNQSIQSYYTLLQFFHLPFHR